MRRLVAMLLTFTLCLQMTGQLAVTAAASSEEKPQKEICNTKWVDDFSTDTIAKYKVAGPDNGAWGNWQVVDGKMQVTGNAPAAWWGTSLLLKDVIYDNFVMEFDADVSAGYGVILRAQDDATTSGSGLNAWFGGNAYVIMHWAPVENNASVQILDYNGSAGGEVLANVGSIGAMTSAHWKIIAEGNDIVISLTDNNNASNKITYTLSNTRYASGMLGFYNLTAAGVTSFKVDNLSVTPINFTLYEDDYSDTTINEYFVAGPNNGIWGNWQAVNGKLQVTGNAGASWWGTSLLTNADYENFVMEFDADVSAGYGIFLRAQDDAKIEGSGLNTWFGGDTYTIMHWAPVESWASVQILDYNGTDGGKVLADVGSIGAMTSAHWKIAAWGNTIYIKLTDNNNSKNTISYILTDSTYAAGHIGFYNLTAAGVTSLKVDNLIIKGEKVITETPSITEPETEVSWSDDMNSSKGDKYTAYGLWWNNAVSAMTQTDYRGVLGNEGGSVDGITYYYLNNYKFNDLVMEFDVAAASSNAQYGVVLRAGNPGDGVDQGDGYTVMYDGNWVFAGKLDGQFTQITSTPSAYAYNPSEHGVTITHWKIVCVGENIAVYFNNSSEPAIWVTDSTYTSGSVGFRAFSPANTVNNVVIDNVLVRGTGTYDGSKPDEPIEPLPPELETYEFEWVDDFGSETFSAYLAYGRWWNNVTSEFNGEDYRNILANEGGIADGVCYYYLRKYKWVDFEMEFDVPSVDNTAQYGVVLRASTYSDAPDDCGGYTIMYDGSWIFVGKLNGSFVQVTNTSSAYAYNPSDHGITPKHWKVTCVGNTIQLYLNGSTTPVISVKDSDFNCGYVGFRTFAKGGKHTNVVFDNLNIKGSVLIEELTTKINSNRRSGTLYDYSVLVESAKKTDKVVVKGDSGSNDTTNKGDVSNSTIDKDTTSNKVTINNVANKTAVSNNVSDKKDTSEESEDKKEVLEEDKGKTDTSEKEKEQEESVSVEEQSVGNTQRRIIPIAIIGLLAVIVVEIIIIYRKRRSS